MKKRAFTLVELLVVISIIAILLAVLMPSLSKARMMGQRVVCMNGARQQFISQMNYTTANNGKFAPHWSATGIWTIRDAGIKSGLNSKTGETAGSAYDAYKSYFKDSRVFLCGAIKDFANESPHDWGMVRDTRWYDNYYKNDKGGWDAVRPNTKPPVQPTYLCIPYNWYANFTPCTVNGGVATPINDVSFYNGATAFPRAITDCSASKALISHIFCTEKGATKFRDMGHGGSTMAWISIRGLAIDSPIIPSTGKMKSVDNPVVYGDGHTKYVMKNELRIRVKYDSENSQLAW